MSSALHYRPEIDGLRALAVLGVVIYHLNPAWLPGGYLGVDIFFVISGFLITSILHRAWQCERFSYKEFYLRRARRILPVMLAVTAATCFASYFILFPDELQNAARACRQALLCSSNYDFAKGDGYFDPGAETNPFLHTWSLGVEEQFYFIFPLLGSFAFRHDRLKARWIGAFVAVGFITASLVTYFKPTYAFFSLESRAWELAVGSWLAVSKERDSTPVWLQGRAAASLGFVLMLGSLILLAHTAATPSPAAVIPVIGAGLFIAGRANKPSLLHGLFTNAPTVYSGRISYALYLVHWPIIVLSKARFGQLNTLHLTAIALSSFAAASILHHYVEEPVRRARFMISDRSFLTITTALSLLCIIAAITTVRLNGRVNRLFLQEIKTILPEYATSEKEPEPPYLIGDVTREPVMGLWGDSHALALIKSLDGELKKQGIACEVWAKSAHLPAAGVLINNNNNPIFADNAINALGKPSIKTIIIASRWSVYIKGPATELGENRKRSVFLKDSNSPVESQRLISNGLDVALKRLCEHDKEIYLFYPIPELGIDAPKMLYKKKQEGLSFSDVELKLPGEAYSSRQDLAVSMLDNLCQKHRVHPVHPEHTLMSNRTVSISKNGLALYCDDNHLSREGAQLVLQSSNISFR